MIKYLKPVSAAAARGVVAEVYAEIKREFGTLGEPLTLHSQIPDLLAAVWASFRECLIRGTARRDLKEAVAVTISRLNRCPYCVDAHTVMLHAAAAHSAASAIQYGHDAEIEDELTRAVVRWSEATVDPDSPELVCSPFPSTEAPEFVGTAVWAHYINRMVHVFLKRRLLPFSSDRLGIRSAAELMGGWYFSRFVRARKPPAGTRISLPDLPLPEDLSWAATSPPIARAFAAFEAAAERAGACVLSPEARSGIDEWLDRWDGKPGELGKGWVDEALRHQNSGSKPAARLALLAAFAPYRVDEKVIRDFTSTGSSEEELLGCLSWASFRAARRIGTLLSGRDITFSERLP
jgi:AhpD family alkylhydroperoxidase